MNFDFTKFYDIYFSKILNCNTRILQTRFFRRKNAPHLPHSGHSCLTLDTVLIDKIKVKSMIIFIVFLLLTYNFVEKMKGFRVLPN